MICYTKQELPHDQVLALDSASECSRCHADVPCPAEAARVNCTHCGLTDFGPWANSPTRRQEVTIHEGMTAMALRARYLRLTGRDSTTTE